ncbi:hypothetical protein Tco_0863447, partial [Tanacetum coccineum]
MLNDPQNQIPGSSSANPNPNFLNYSPFSNPDQQILFQDQKLLLAECFMQISEDPKLGSDKKNDTFSKFNSLVNETKAMSGENDENWMTLIGIRAKVIENQVMAAPIISISSDTSEESMGSHALRVILFGAIPAIIPVIHEVPVVPADPIVAPEEGTVLVVLPSGVLDLVDYSPSSDSDPSEDSLPPAPDLSLVSPFLCFNDTEADSESEPAEQRPVSSSHDTLAPLSEFPLAPVVAPPGIHRRSMTLVRPGEAIPFGRPYRTHPNGPRKLLTARKRVRPIFAHRLAWRRVSHHLSDCHSLPDS